MGGGGYTIVPVAIPRKIAIIQTVQMRPENQLYLSISISGLLLAIFGILSKRLLFILSGILILTIIMIMVFRFVKVKARLKKANICIDGNRIDALNIANLSRKTNDTFVVERVCHYYKILDDNLEICFEYSGHCVKGPVEDGFIFSVDSDTYTPFEKLLIYGHDLKHDPDRKQRIQPILNDKDGLTKKIKLPFLKKILPGQPFHVALFCELYGCMKKSDYVIATLSFKNNKKINEFYVFIEFLDAEPQYLRLYDGTKGGNAKLIKELEPYYRKNNSTYYMDSYAEIEPDKALVYYYQINQ